MASGTSRRRGPTVHASLKTGRVELSRVSGVETRGGALEFSQLDDELIQDLIKQLCPKSLK